MTHNTVLISHAYKARVDALVVHPQVSDADKANAIRNLYERAGVSCDDIHPDADVIAVYKQNNNL